MRSIIPRLALQGCLDRGDMFDAGLCAGLDVLKDAPDPRVHALYQHSLLAIRFAPNPGAPAPRTVLSEVYHIAAVLLIRIRIVYITNGHDQSPRLFVEARHRQASPALQPHLGNPSKVLPQQLSYGN